MTDTTALQTNLAEQRELAMRILYIWESCPTAPKGFTAAQHEFLAQYAFRLAELITAEWLASERM